MWDANPYYLILLAAVASVMASLLAIVLAELLLNGTISSWIKNTIKGSLRAVSRLFHISSSSKIKNSKNLVQEKTAASNRQPLASFDLAKVDIFQFLQSRLNFTAKKNKIDDNIAVGQDYVSYKSRVGNYEELLVSYHTSLLLQKQLEHVTENLLCLIGNKNYDGEIHFDYMPLEQLVRYSWYQITNLPVKHRMLCDINITKSKQVYSDELKMELLLASIFCNVLCLFQNAKSTAVSITEASSNANLLIKISTTEPPSLDSIQLFNMLYSDKSIANIFKRHEMCLAILKIIAELLNARIRATRQNNNIIIEVSGLLIV